jgi:hypothetical protein
MKHALHFIPFILFLFAGPAVPAQQSAFEDTRYLQQNCFTVSDGGQFQNHADFLAIMRKYYPGLTDAEIDSATSYNPFFGSYVPLWASGPGISGFTDIASKIGGLNVSNFADGLAKFLVERTKEEMNIAFFERFRNVLNAYPEMKVLFPKTTRY